jgi:beta-N-acetylhexosaminidase
MVSKRPKTDSTSPSAPNLDQAKQKVGQLFITGFRGLELSLSTEDFIRRTQLGGVILFAHNYDSPAQVAELIQQVQSCRGDLPLWVAVDQEGGRVQRFKSGFTRLPDALTLGDHQSPKLAFEVGKMMAAELKAVGVNLNFAPVADIFTNPKNPVIGNRAYGRTEEQVTQMVSGIVRGHLVNHVQPCVKHFPGHGETSVDSHFALPSVTTDLATLKEREFKPFLRAFRSHCEFVMTAHILNSTVDDRFPATLSRRTVTDILKKELRFRGLVITDDMEMQAITDHFGATEAPVLALEAGCDHLLYRTESAAETAIQAVQAALDSGRISPARVHESVNKIDELKRKVLLPFQAVDVSRVKGNLDLAAHQALIDQINKK